MLSARMLGRGGGAKCAHVGCAFFYSNSVRPSLNLEARQHLTHLAPRALTLRPLRFQRFRSFKPFGLKSIYARLCVIYFLLKRA